MGCRVLGNCHGHIMAMSDFMGMAMGVPCDGHDHAMFAGINMVMTVSWSWRCHSQGKGYGEGHDPGQKSKQRLRSWPER